MRALAVCLFMHCIAIGTAQANERQDAQRLLVTVRASEPLVMAAIKTRDVLELQRQATSLRSEIAGQPEKVSDRYDACTRAVVELAALSDWMAMTNTDGLDAPKYLGLKAIYDRWSSEIADCETALKDRQRRELVLGFRH